MQKEKDQNPKIASEEQLMNAMGGFIVLRTEWFDEALYAGCVAGGFLTSAMTGFIMSLSENMETCKKNT